MNLQTVRTKITAWLLRYGTPLALAAGTVLTVLNNGGVGGGSGGI